MTLVGWEFGDTNIIPLVLARQRNGSVGWRALGESNPSCKNENLES